MQLFYQLSPRNAIIALQVRTLMHGLKRRKHYLMQAARISETGSLPAAAVPSRLHISGTAPPAGPTFSEQGCGAFAVFVVVIAVQIDTRHSPHAFAFF